jgi:CcmD family protein
MDSLYNFLNTNAYYGLLAIILIIWTGMFMYVQSLNKKVNKLKKQNV